MKAKVTTFIPVLLFLAGLGSLLVFALDVSVQALLIVCLVGVLAGLFHSLFKVFVVPPKWFFKMRFIFYGLTFTGFICMGSAIAINEDSFQLNWATLFSWLLVGLGAGAISHWRYLKMCIKTKIQILENEEILQSDYATALKEGQLHKGRLILTNKRLCFRSVLSDKYDFDCLLSDKNSFIDLSKSYGLPVGLKLGQGDVIVKMAFSKMWFKKLNA